VTDDNTKEFSFTNLNRTSFGYRSQLENHMMIASYGTLTFNDYIDFIYGGVDGNSDRLETLMAFIGNAFDFFDLENFPMIEKMLA
jgi:hypothetical protein